MAKIELCNEQTAKKLKGEYLDQKDLSKEIGKVEASKAAQQKVQNNLSQQFTKTEHQRMKLAMNIEKGIQNQKKELAQIVAEDAKGLAIDEKRKGVLEAQINNTKTTCEKLSDTEQTKVINGFIEKYEKVTRRK